MPSIVQSLCFCFIILFYCSNLCSLCWHQTFYGSESGLLPVSASLVLELKTCTTPVSELAYGYFCLTLYKFICGISNSRFVVVWTMPSEDNEVIRNGGL